MLLGVTEMKGLFIVGASLRISPCASECLCPACAPVLLHHRLDVGLQKWFGLLENSSQRVEKVPIVSSGWSFLLYFVGEGSQQYFS